VDDLQLAVEKAQANLDQILPRLVELNHLLQLVRVP